MILKANEVLEFIRPEGGWATYGDKYEDIVFVECEPLTKEQFDVAAKVADKELKIKAEAKATARQALLTRLGITEEEARILLGGN